MVELIARSAAWSARIVSRRPLLYRRGADPTLDRPAHVRAASGLCWVGQRLVVVQDDARFLGVVDPGDAHVDDVPLPPGPGGRRVFDAGIGNKLDKPDLEVAFAEGGALVALGSGGPHEARQVMVRWRPGEDPAVHPRPDLFERLSDRMGRPLNLEGGARSHDGRLFLAQRGGHGGVAPDVLAWLTDLDGPIAWAARVQLGDGLHLTDLAPAPDGLWFAAAAEATTHFAEDGAVTGVAIGRIRPHLDGFTVERATVLDEAGAPATDKIEGLAPHPAGRDRLFAVTDPDDPDRPGELLELTV